MVAPEFWYSSGAMGGFSSLQLPSPGLCGANNGLLIWCDGTTTPQASAGLVVTLDSGTSLAESSGGPFDEPYFPSAEYTTADYRITGAGLDMSGDFWVELWYRRRRPLGAEGPAANLVSVFRAFSSTSTERIRARYTDSEDSGTTDLISLTGFSPDLSDTTYAELESLRGSWRFLMIAKTGDSVYGWNDGDPIDGDPYVGTIAPLDLSGGSLALLTGVDIGQARFTVGTCPYSEGSTSPVPSAPFVAI